MAEPLAARSFNEIQRENYRSLLGLENPLLGHLYYEMIKLRYSYDPRTEDARITLMQLSHCARELMNRFPDYTGGTEVAESNQGSENASLERLKDVLTTEGDGLREPSKGTQLVPAPPSIVRALIAYRDALSQGSSKSMQRSSLAALGYIDESSATAKAWKSILDYFVSYAHIHGIESGALPTQEQIAGKLDAVDNALSSRFGAFFRAKHKVEGILSKANAEKEGCYQEPSGQEVEEALLLIAQPSLRYAFFSGLKNPKWLAPLKKLGAFSSVSQKSASSNTYNSWPEGTYLKRLTGSFPSEVVSILQGLQKSDNPSYRQAFIEIAASLPAREATPLGPTIKSWAEEKYGSGTYFWESDDLIKLIQGFIQSGEGAARRYGQNIIRSVFSASPSSNLFSTEASAISLVPAYFYEKRLSESLESLTVRERLGLLTHLLGSCYNEETRERNSAMSHILLPKVCDVYQGQYQAPFFSIIRLLISNLDQLLTDDPERFKTKIRDNHSVIRRICMYCLHERIDSIVECGLIGKPIQECISDALCSNDIYDIDLRFEYFTLAKDAIRLKAVPVEQIEELIVQGREVKTEAYLSLTQGEDDQSAFEQAKEYSERWQQGALDLIGEDSLSPRGKEFFYCLNLKYGETQHRLEAINIQTVIGPNSPIQLDAVEEMKAGDLLKFLESWHPDNHDSFKLVTHDGLARTITAFVSSHPKSFMGHIGRIVHLRPIYQRAIVEGWMKAVIKQHPIPVQDLVDVAKSAAEADENLVLDTEGSSIDDDSSFKPLKRSCVDALSTLLQSDTPLTDEQGFAILEILITLSNSSDPSIEDEDTWRRADPLNVSINTIRPSATIALGHWIERFPSSFRMNDALSALEKHLPVEISTISDAAAIGQIYPILLNIEPAWIEKNYLKLFGKDAPNAWQQVLLTTILACFSPQHKLFTNLRIAITSAITHEPSSFELGFKRHESDNCTKLIGTWLYRLYVSGVIIIDDPLLHKWWSVAKPEEIGFCLKEICKMTCNFQSLGEGERDRIKTLWKLHKDKMSDEVRVESLTGIEGLILSGHFESEWWGTELLSCIRFGIKGISLRLLDDSLRSLSSTHPLLALDILAEYAAKASDYMSLVTTDTAVFILNNAKQKDQAEYEEIVSKCMDRLGVLGFYSLDDLVK